LKELLLNEVANPTHNFVDYPVWKDLLKILKLTCFPSENTVTLDIQDEVIELAKFSIPEGVREESLEQDVMEFGQKILEKLDIFFGGNGFDVKVLESRECKSCKTTSETASSTLFLLLALDSLEVVGKSSKRKGAKESFNNSLDDCFNRARLQNLDFKCSKCKFFESSHSNKVTYKFGKFLFVQVNFVLIIFIICPNLLTLTDIFYSYNDWVTVKDLEKLSKMIMRSHLEKR
jgi:hypothetical protein